MNRIKTDAGDRIHSRKVDMAVFALDAGKIVVEGVLKDERHFTSHVITGETRPPGILHHMIMRMVVSGPKLVIEDIEVKMPQTPRKECREAESSLQPVIGMTISSGFTNRVKTALSGPIGCSHLVSLLLAMAPAAVQGFWSDVVRTPHDPSEFSQLAMDVVLDTCHVWRSDGPVVKEYREKLGLLQDNLTENAR